MSPEPAPRTSIATAGIAESRPTLFDVIRATAERMRQEQAVESSRRFVLTVLRDGAIASGWAPFVPAMIKPWERRPIAYTNGKSVVTLIERSGGKWYVESAAVAHGLVASGTVAILLRGNGGRREHTLRGAARTAVAFMRDNKP